MRKFMRTRSAGASPPPHTVDSRRHSPETPLSNGVTVVRRDAPGSASSRYLAGEGLWVDREFPPCARSLGHPKAFKDVEWRRPHEICPDPVFLGEEGSGVGEEDALDDGSRTDDIIERWAVQVGSLGSDAVCAAVSALALTPRLLARVAPPQSFRRDYTGAFRFVVWVFGSWREVVVDDLLPTRRGQLLTSRRGPPRHCDFTLPLLEKALAKAYGSWARSRRDASLARVLQDLTGAVVQELAPVTSLQALHSAAPRATLLLASRGRSSGGHGGRGGRGQLSEGAAYVVSGLARAKGASLVRVGSAAQEQVSWRGLWSPRGAEWRALAQHDRDLLADKTEPHEFWMSFSEFCCAFGCVVMAHLGPDEWLREPSLHPRRPWRAVLARRRWRRGHNAGGPPSCAATTASNPQFVVQIPGEEGSEARCHVVLSVTQRYSMSGGARLQRVGFALLALPPLAAGGGWRSLAPLAARLQPLEASAAGRAREVASFFTLPPGDFLVVPHAGRAGDQGSFLLRVLTDRQASVWEVNDDNVVLRSVAAEVADYCPLPEESRRVGARLACEEDEDQVDAEGLRQALRRAGVGGGCAGRGVRGTRLSRELALTLLALRGADSVPRRELGALVRVVRSWLGAWAGARRSQLGVGHPRALLWAAGVRASNKVLELSAARFPPPLDAPSFLLLLARIHLAHERYRVLESKAKSIPLSLEEMILMTVFP